MDKLNGLCNNIKQHVKVQQGNVSKDLKDYLIKLNEPENRDKKNFMLSALEIIDSLGHSQKRKVRHLHVAVARLMETINFFNDNKYKPYYL